jgi:hypothetical protein
MKTNLTVLIIVLLAASYTNAQSLNGRWRLISVKGTEPDGKKFMFDDRMVKETVIINGVHFLKISQDPKTDSLLIEQTFAGDLKITGNKFEEIPTISAMSLSDKAKANFTWRIENDRLIESGEITLSNGMKVVVEESVYKRLPQ